MIIVDLAIVVFIVYMSNAERLSVQYAKARSCTKMAAVSHHLPIKVNASGVMPIVFASSIPQSPPDHFRCSGAESGSVGARLNLFSQTSVVLHCTVRTADHNICMLLPHHQFNPIEIANNLKKNGG